MTFRLTTFATPLQIAAFHAGGKKPKPFKRGPMLIEGLTRWATDGSWVELDLPVSVQAQHDYMRSNKFAEAATKKRHLTICRSALVQLTSLDRDAITDVTFTRFSAAAETKNEMDSDNLGWSLKHFRDLTALWIVTGKLECPKHEWGGHDGELKQRFGRDIWHYQNAKHETDKRLQGIRIRLRLGSLAAPSTAP